MLLYLPLSQISYRVPKPFSTMGLDPHSHSQKNVCNWRKLLSAKSYPLDQWHMVVLVSVFWDVEEAFTQVSCCSQCTDTSKDNSLGSTVIHTGWHIYCLHLLLLGGLYQCWLWLITFVPSVSKILKLITLFSAWLMLKLSTTPAGWCCL